MLPEFAILVCQFEKHNPLKHRCCKVDSLLLIKTQSTVMSIKIIDDTNMFVLMVARDNYGLIAYTAKEDIPI